MNFNLIILFFQNNPYTVNVAAAIGLTAAAVITLYKYNHNNKHTPPKSTKRQKEQSSVFLSFLSRLWPMKKMKNFNNILPTHSVDGSLPAVTGQPNSAQETRSNRVNNNPAQTRSNNSSTHTSSHQTERRQPKPSSAPETRSDSNRKKRAQKANVSSEAQTSSEQTQNSNSAPETRSDSNGGEVADSESAIIQAEQAATGDHQSVGQSGRNTDNGLPQTIEATVNTVEANKESTSRAINSSTQTSSHQTERRQPKPSSAPGTRSDSNGGEVADSESAKTPAKKVATGDHQSVGQSERNTDNRLPQTTEATVNRVEANKEATSRAIVLFHPHETDIPYQVIGLFSQVSNHQSVYSLVGDRASTVGQSVLPTTGEN
ncbi:MAG: hypothetical protein CMF46_05020, partial [Legionellales bacterium]|nr:hypothetical protein [Legionellales bacterium]